MVHSEIGDQNKNNCHTYNSNYPDLLMYNTILINRERIGDQADSSRMISSYFITNVLVEVILALSALHEKGILKSTCDMQRLSLFKCLKNYQEYIYIKTIAFFPMFKIFEQLLLFCII